MLFPTWEQSIPNTGIKYSQRGNICIMPYYEPMLTKKLMFFSGIIFVRLNKNINFATEYHI